MELKYNEKYDEDVNLLHQAFPLDYLKVQNT